MSHIRAVKSTVENNVNHTATLDHFPELWVEILRRLPEFDRLRHVPLVNRRFSQACRDPSTWPDMHVLHAAFPTEAHWQSFLRWLTVRASGLRSFILGPEPLANEQRFLIWSEIPWERRTPDLMALLAASAPQLQSLCYRYPGIRCRNMASALPAALSQLSQLTSLSLNVGSAPVTAAQVNAMVQGLPSLQYLDLAGKESFLDDGFPVLIAKCCSQLETLHIRGGFDGDTPPELGCLTRLTKLMLGNCCASLPASVLHLTALQNVVVINEIGQMELPEQLWQLGSITHLALRVDDVILPSSISQLTALKELELTDGTGLVLPLGLTACRNLTYLIMESEAGSPVLARLQSLRSLIVVMFWTQSPDSTYWSQLTGLTELSIDVSRCHISQYSGMSGMTSLRALEIYYGSGLPEGPYLSRLQSLGMIFWDLKSGIPTALRGAAQLQKLELTPPPELNANGAAALVVSLPTALKTLTMVYSPHTFTTEEWSQRVSGLQASFVAQGRAPPVIESHAQ